MRWIDGGKQRVPIASWCADIEPGAMKQAENVAAHPRVFHHVALMPDCHQGFGMPIGGVAGFLGAVIPNAVGVDIGCGMRAVRTNFPAAEADPHRVRRCLERLRKRIPVGEGHAHSRAQSWERFDELPDWLDKRGRDLARHNLGTLGGGNHFIELQAGDDGFLWLMLHSGSRNLGYRIAEHHHRKAVARCRREGIRLPSEELAFLDAESDAGEAYIREMHFALDYARENRARMTAVFRETVMEVFGAVEFDREIDIHHNYAALEEHFGEKVWLHRKGATAAREGETGIIPGSMGASSYIVRGLGNPDSFCSCSHGAGRRMGRLEASRTLSREACDRAMEGIVFFGWQPLRGRGKKGRGLLDLSEAPQAYKDIDEVIAAERDLVEPLVRLRPLGVLKG